MQVTSLEIDCRNRKPVKIVFCGDDHLGADNCCKKTQARVINHIAKNDCFWMHTGDGIEAISKSDLRCDVRGIDKEIVHDFEDLDRMLQLQIKAFVDAYKPIKDKLIAAVDGNHPDKLRRMYGIDPYYEMMLGLRPQKTKYKRLYGSHSLGYDGFVVLILRLTKSQLHRVVIYIHHGYTASRTRGAMVNSLNNMFNSMVADVIVVGHAHNLADVRMQRIEVTQGYEIKHHHKLGISVPSLLKTYSDGEYESYAGRRGYPPAYIGAVELAIDPDVFYLPSRADESPYQYRVI